jgi:hypothetical protein
MVALIISLPVQACTAWEVAGSSVKDGGTIIAKNRDYSYGERNELKIVDGRGGYKYLAIYANTGNKGGVNEKGLVVLSLSAPSHLENHMDSSLNGGSRNYKFNNSWILTHYKTVDETINALRQGQWVTHPEFIALADKNKVAYIELGPDGIYAARSVDNGILDHTNHYLETDMVNFNPEKLGYGFKRWKKAEEQLKSQKQFTMDDIHSFTQDPIVWYKHSKIMTYASMVVNNRPDDETLIWVKIANPGEAPYEMQFTLDEALSGKVQLPH